MDSKQILAQIQDGISDVADFCVKFGIVDRRQLSGVIDMIKTIAQFRRNIQRAVLLLWRGDESVFGFIDRMTYAIEEQYRRAWNEGMRELGLDPVRDLLAEWELVLLERIDQEYNYVLDFADAIEQASRDEKPVDALYSRAELWVQRYNEIKNLAKMTCGRDKKLEWVVGPTEHCGTCGTLNGQVAYASEWANCPYKPQGRNLECGGYNCQCTLSPTDKPRTGITI